VAILAAVARWRRQLLDKVLTPAVVALVTSVVVWQWQQGQLQRWSSQAVVDVDITNDKALSIHNAGVVALSDLDVYLTSYTVGLKVKEAGHVYFTGEIESFSKAGGRLKHWDVLPSGQTIRYELLSDQALKNLGAVFHDFPSAGVEGIKQQYAFRVAFRNGVTKQKYVRYVITPAFNRGPSLFNFSQTEAFGGPFDTADKFFSIRKKIRGHQAELFDDAPQDLYR